jgi:hypothetical protein
MAPRRRRNWFPTSGRLNATRGVSTGSVGERTSSETGREMGRDLGDSVRSDYR